MTGSYEVAEDFVCVEHPTDPDAPARTSASALTSSASAPRKRSRADSDIAAAECASDVEGQIVSSYLSKKFERAVEGVQVDYMPFLDESSEDDATFAKLWALYRQIRLGDADHNSTPSSGHKKRRYAEWCALEGTTREECMRRYIGIAKGVASLDFTPLKFEVAQEKIALYYLPFVGEEGDRDLYRLFGLFKQATAGDVPEDVVPEDDTNEAKQKLAAWKAEKGRDATECMKEYCTLADTVTRTIAVRQRA